MPPQGSTAASEAATRWAQVEALFDEARTLPPGQRAALLAQRAGNDEALIRDVQALLDSAETRGDLFDRPAAALLGTEPIPGLRPGSRVGAYRVLGLVGRGGMGEVYRAERADGQFQQQVALKLIRREAVDQLERFHDERNILARLEHPGIARLYDGGVSDDGRPYMAMEWVEGQPITDWCAGHHADLALRLDVFLQVCDAVGYAHRNLLVHRDLKPGNVLVTQDGRAKLLDFGVAKLLTDASDETLTQAPLTPAYAAPEQLITGTITTATDVYALGLILFELLTGQRPFHRPQMSLPALLDQQQRETAPAPSAVASKLDRAVVTPKGLRGDLDAIVGYALRREPERRYRSAAELADDLRRHLEGQPVLARPESLRYTLGTFIRRNRTAAAFAALAVAALVIGLAAALWQAQKARIAAQTAEQSAQKAKQEAARATATKDFLVNVFRASDPRIAQDKPRGQITAKELLDLNAPKIREEFKNDPETQIELLGITASIYGALDDKAGYAETHSQYLEAARRVYGELHPIFIQGLLDDIEEATYREEPAEAARLLGQADVLITRAGLDRTALRAWWWYRRATDIQSHSDNKEATASALQRAVSLFAEVAPDDRGYGEALYALAWQTVDRDPVEGEAHLLEAIAVFARQPDRDAVSMHALYNGLATAREARGDLDGAEHAYEQAAELVQKSIGEDDSQHWLVAAAHGSFLVRRGKREQARAVFERLLPHVGGKGADESAMARVEQVYGASLSIEGRPTEAITWLDRARARYSRLRPDSTDMIKTSWSLANAYDSIGRLTDARAMFRRILETTTKNRPPDDPMVLAQRERWGRFLLAQGDADTAEREFREVITRSKPDAPSEAALLARGDMARIAILRNDTGAALEFSRQAIGDFDRVVGRRDVRTPVRLWLIHSEALRVSGNPKSAGDFAQRALDASKQYDDSHAPSIAAAQIALANCYLDLGDKAKAQALAEEAHAIHATHKELGPQYREPLKQLETRLGRP